MAKVFCSVRVRLYVAYVTIFRPNSVQINVTVFNYLKKKNRFINKVIDVIAHVICLLIFSILNTTFKDLLAYFTTRVPDTSATRATRVQHERQE